MSLQASRHTYLPHSTLPNSTAVPTRAGFSLLEVMLATAILASSALVLSSLLGLGAKFGSRAEQQTEALSQAQSLMDEFLAFPSREGEPSEELEGELPGPPPRSYRIRVVPRPLPSSLGFGTSTDSTGSPAAESGGGLVEIIVEVFESSALRAGAAEAPICRLTQLVRQHRLSIARVASTAASDNGGPERARSELP